MRKLYARNIIKNVVCWILLLQMINISVDPPDFKRSVASPSDEIDTIYELISENVFDSDVPDEEGGDNDLDESSNSIQLYFSDHGYQLLSFDFPLTHYPFYQDNFSRLVKEPTSPPPKQA